MAIVQVSTLAQPLAVVVAAPYAAEGPLIAGTSNSANAVDTLSAKSFIINEYNRSFYPGTRLRATAVGYTNIWMEGIVTAWDGQTVTFTPGLSAGGGVYSNWDINVAGQPGVQGPTGPAGPIGPSGGATGPQGPPGTPGSVWRNGNGVPSNSLGADGDYYLNNSNGDVYLRSATTHAYFIVANIEGPTGLTGATGSVGPIGLTGPAGTPANAWHDGTGVPSSTLGADGDYYLDDVSGKVYNKQTGTWVVVATLQGPPGPTGPAGPVGAGTGDVLMVGTPTNGQLAQWTGAGTIQGIAIATLGFAPIASPAFTGIPTGPTPAGTDNSTFLATTAFVKGQAYATLASPIFTGNPTGPTRTAGDSSTSLATTAFSATANANTKSAIVGSASSPMDTLGGIQNYINSNITPVLNNKANSNNPVFTGDPQAPTATVGDNDTSIATTAFVTAAISNAVAALGAKGNPGGRLTLVTGTPVLSANQINQGTVYYTPHVHDLVPIYDGTKFTMRQFTEQSVSLDVTNFLSGKQYDFFLFDNAGVIALGYGSAWTSNVTRNDLISRLQGNFVNTNTITLRTNASTTFSVAASKAFWVGTARATANGQTGMNFLGAAAAGGTVNAILGLYNAYNRVPVACMSRDSASYAYASATWRRANNNGNNSVSFVDGLGDQFISAEYQQYINNGPLAGGGAIGININATTGQPTIIAAGIIVQGGGVTGAGATARASGVFAPTLGYNTLQAMENADGTNATSFGNGAGWAALFLRALM